MTLSRELTAFFVLNYLCREFERGAVAHTATTNDGLQRKRVTTMGLEVECHPDMLYKWLLSHCNPSSHHITFLVSASEMPYQFAEKEGEWVLVDGSDYQGVEQREEDRIEGVRHLRRHVDGIRQVSGNAVTDHATF